jgi:hypothetical protein
MRKTLLCLLCVLFVSVSASSQDKRGPSTPEERNKALAMIEDFEKNPLGPSAKDERQWLTIWLIEVPDIHVKICTLIDLPKGSKKDSDVIFSAMMFGGAREAIEHKDDPVDELAQYRAGMASALKVYELLIAQNPKDRQPALDDLIQKRGAGTLDVWVSERAAKECKSGK